MPEVLTLAETSTMTLILWIGIMIGAVFVATVAVLMFRRKLLAGDSSTHGPMLMSDLRRLHASGKLTEAEFSQLSARLAGRLKAAGGGGAAPAVADGHQPQPAQRRAGGVPSGRAKAE